jgi:hypothetical protein
MAPAGAAAALLPPPATPSRPGPDPSSGPGTPSTAVSRATPRGPPGYAVPPQSAYAATAASASAARFQSRVDAARAAIRPSSSSTPGGYPSSSSSFSAGGDVHVAAAGPSATTYAWQARPATSPSSLPLLVQHMVAAAAAQHHQQQQQADGSGWGYAPPESGGGEAGVAAVDDGVPVYTLATRLPSGLVRDVVRQQEELTDRLRGQLRRLEEEDELQARLDENHRALLAIEEAALEQGIGREALHREADAAASMQPRGLAGLSTPGGAGAPAAAPVVATTSRVPPHARWKAIGSAIGGGGAGLSATTTPSQFAATLASPAGRSFFAAAAAAAAAASSAAGGPETPSSTARPSLSGGLGGTMSMASIVLSAAAQRGREKEREKENAAPSVGSDGSPVSPRGGGGGLAAALLLAARRAKEEGEKAAAAASAASAEVEASPHVEEERGRGRGRGGEGVPAARPTLLSSQPLPSSLPPEARRGRLPSPSPRVYT